MNDLTPILTVYFKKVFWDIGIYPQLYMFIIRTHHHIGYLPIFVYTSIVKPRPEAHMDMILLKCFWRASTWFHNNIYYNGTIYIIDNVIVLSDLVESNGYSSKTLQKGSWP